VKELIRSAEWVYARCLEDCDCILWQGAVDLGGRPRVTIRVNSKAVTHQPRRMVWESAKGPIPPKRYVTITCDNPLCVNADHLALITKAQVISRTAQKPDVQKRRVLAGLKRRESSRLDIETARYIRASDKSGAQLARELALPPTTVSAIRLHKRWRETSNPFAGLMA
jgi:hypothetical protein